jgi:ATP-binding cassette, subfamily B, bacterial
MRLVTALRAEDHELARFKTRNDAFVGTMLRMQLASFMTGALPGAILTASSAAVVLYGGSRIIDGSMTIGSLVAFMAYHARLFSPIQVLMGLSSGLASARVSLGRIFELFDTKPEVVERRDAVPLDAVRDGIRLEGVKLRHGARTVLDDLSLFIPQGSFCAVLGPSGAGKSTLAELIVRFLDADAGRVEIDGRDVRTLRLTDLRREVLLVDQAPHLFNDTIAANIAFARPDASEAEVQAAAHAAGLDALLQRLPEGLDTRTGERGLALSAGERQRVALARALLRRPSVLILDEPSSALDVQTEALVVERTRAALPEATIILITHRAQLAEDADLTITLADGRAQLAVRPTAVAA